MLRILRAKGGPEAVVLERHRQTTSGPYRNRTYAGNKVLSDTLVALIRMDGIGGVSVLVPKWARAPMRRRARAREAFRIKLRAAVHFPGELAKVIEALLY